MPSTFVPASHEPQSGKTRQSEYHFNLSPFYIQGRSELLILPAFIELQASVQCRDEPTISEVEYSKLLNAFFNSRPSTGNLMSWFYGNYFILKEVLKMEGINVYVPDLKIMHEYILINTGISRLTELEIAIINKSKETQPSKKNL